MEYEPIDFTFENRNLEIRAARGNDEWVVGAFEDDLPVTSATITVPFEDSDKAFTDLVRDMMQTLRHDIENGVVKLL